MANSRYAPEFHISINDTAVPAAMRASISSVSLQTGLEGADRVELTLVNENMRWLDHPLLKMDNQLKLEIGYAPDPLTQAFAGEIIGQSATFPSGGSPMLTVSAQDRRQRLQQGAKQRWFGIPVPCYGNTPIPDAAIAAQVSAEHELFPIIGTLAAAMSTVLGGIDALGSINDPKEMQKLIRRQTGESDFDLLTRIARENGWEMLVDHTEPNGGQKLVFMSPADHLTPDVTLKYGQSLVDFTPRISNVGQIASVTVFVWISEIKTQFSITLSWDWDRQALTLDFSGSASDQKGPSETYVQETLTAASAPRKLVSELIPKLNKRLTGSGSTIGDPRIQAGTVLQLEGLGTQFGGLYRVTSATHTIDGGGYRTNFEVRKEIWFGSIPLASQGATPVPSPIPRLN
jgi:phage protein D